MIVPTVLRRVADTGSCPGDSNNDDRGKDSGGQALREADSIGAAQVPGGRATAAGVRVANGAVSCDRDD